jgi:hypothetical protein
VLKLALVKNMLISIPGPFVGEAKQNLDFTTRICRLQIDQVFAQNFQTIVSIITNIAVFQTLLAGLTITILLTIPSDEFINGDIVSMAYCSRSFRCRFAPNSTFDICFGPGNFSEAACRLRDAALKIGCENDVFRSVLVGDCEKANLVESRRIANSVDKASFLLWVDQTLFAGRINTNADYTGGTAVPSDEFFSYLIPDAGVCLPSMRMAYYGFLCIYHTILPMFVSLCLFMSVSLSRSQEDSMERLFWWCPVGLAFVLFVFVELFYSVLYFTYYAEYVIAIRFPYIQHSSLWKQMIVEYSPRHLGSSKNSLVNIVSSVCLPLIGAHFLIVRSLGAVWRLWPAACRGKGGDKVQDSDEPVHPDLLAFMERTGLDLETLQSAENDLLLREELACAGVSNPRDRLRLIRHIRSANPPPPFP